MSFLHEFRVKLRDQWENGVHILDSIIKSNKSFPILDFFVLWILWVCLLGLHIFNKLHELVCIDFVPKSGFPGFELEIN